MRRRYTLEAQERLKGGRSHHFNKVVLLATVFCLVLLTCNFIEDKTYMHF